MAFQRPTLSEITARIFSDITSRLSLQGSILRRSVVGVLARALAGASHLMHGHIDNVSREAIPDSAIEALPRWASIWGIARKGAEYASGTVSLTGTLNGIVLPAGATLKRSDGVEFVTQADATIAAGIASVAVKALDAGALANTDAGVSLSLVYPVANIGSSATVAAGGLTNGSDVESLDSLRARLLERIRKPPHGGNQDDYLKWALEVPGVTRAWCYPLHLGPGTVGITFVRDDDASLIPDSAEVAAVQSYINDRRPVTAAVTVFAPVAVSVNFTISITPDTQAVRDAVTAELSDFFAREATPGGTLKLSRIREAISLAAGEESHVLTSPSADVARTTGQISKLGVITWA